MELVELLRRVVEELEPYVERDIYLRRTRDPDRDIERLVVVVGRILDKGLLIGRGI